MNLRLDKLTEFLDHGFDALIDVRSPAEFGQDHLPGAINLPVLSDTERARVGKIYVRDNAFTAKKIGAALVAKNAARHLEGPLAAHDGAWRPLIYCWRGGQRSGAFASILTQVGWRAEVIQGGYKSYRRMVAAAMYEQPLAPRLIVLDGNTGTAKTELLHLLAARGQQVVDLEGLAAHRGSVFGAVARAQPSQKAFEGALAVAFAGFDANRPVLIEAESSKIGTLLIPPSLWDAMKSAPRIKVGASLAERANYLSRAYADISHNSDRLVDRLSRLQAHQGREQVETWQSLARQARYVELASGLMQAHYDPSYARSRARHGAKILGEVRARSLSDEGLAQVTDQILTLIKHAR